MMVSENQRDGKNCIVYYGYKCNAMDMILCQMAVDPIKLQTNVKHAVIEALSTTTRSMNQQIHTEAHL